MPFTYLTLHERFFQKVNVDGPIPEHCPELGSCWVWTASCKKDGYGIFHLEAKVATTAHRTSWLFHFGPITDGKSVLHRCDNPPCIRPSHLFLGTQLENIRDRDRKGRNKSEFTPEQIAEIRKLYANGMLQWKIGQRFGMSQANVSCIVRCLTHPVRQSW